MSGTDHQAVYDFLRTLETKGVPGGFSGYGGSNPGGGIGTTLFPYSNQLPPGAKYNYEAEAGDLWRNSALASALGWLERNFPEPRLKVVTKGPGHVFDEVEGHEAPALIEEPNPFYDADILWSGTLISYVCDGNAYWLKGRTVGGRRTREFYYIPHWQMFPRWPADGSKLISHYEYVVDGERTKLRPNQVVHFRNGLDPRDTRRGWSKVKTAVREICTDNQAAGFAATTCRNMGVPGVVIMPEGDEDTIEDDERKRLKAQWREETTDEARGTALVSSARLKIQEITLSPEKMVLDKIRTIPESRILSAVGLNAQVLGLTSGEKSKTFSNYEQARLAAYEDCVVPTQTRLARQLTRQCPELFAPGERLAWDYSAVPAMQGDAAEKAKRGVVLYQGALAKLDEARAVAGLSPVGPKAGGDQFHAGAQLAGTEPRIQGNTLKDAE